MYDGKLKETTVAYTFGNKTAEKYNENPGPGTYDAEYEKIKANQ